MSEQGPVPPTADAKFAGAAFFLPGVVPKEWYGTYINGDDYTGTATSTLFRLEKEVAHIPILGFPKSAGNQLTLQVFNSENELVKVITYDGANPTETPRVWHVDVAAWQGMAACLVLTDGTTGHGGWLAVGDPGFRGGWLKGVSWSTGWYGAATLAVATLLFLPGLALRIWHSRFPTSTALLPVPGMLLLSAIGWIAWMAPPVGTVVAGIALATALFVALALMRSWWAHGIPIAHHERHSLLIYVCVAASALLFGLLPLDVAQEFDRRSTAQARMIASPPDHGIPYRTAVFFLHGKSGNEDRVIYFGEDWSVASRGPLVPLILTGVFAIFDVRPYDPPRIMLERWPVSSDAFYLARIVGVLTNALVIIGAGALAARFAPQAGRLALACLAVSPVIVINTDFLWPKLLATFFIILAVSAVLDRSAARAGLWAALGYLSHPIAGLFIPPLAAFLAVQTWQSAGEDRRARPWLVVRAAGTFAGCILCCLSPWVFYKLQLGFADPFLYYVLGDGRGFQRAASIESWLRARGSSLWYTLAPGAFFAGPFGGHWLEGPVSQPLRWAIGYAKTLPGGMGHALFVLGTLVMFRRRVATPTGFRSILLLGAFAVTVVFWGFSRDGLGDTCLQPLTVLAIVYAATVARLPPWAWSIIVLVTALEALSVRLIGIVFAPAFSWAAFDLRITTLVVATIATMFLPVIWCCGQILSKGEAR